MQGTGKETWTAGWYFRSCMLPISRPSTLNSQELLQPLTISTAVRDVACWRLNPGHDFSQVSEARAWEGEYLWGGVGEALEVGVI